MAAAEEIIFTGKPYQRGISKKTKTAPE